MKSWAQSPARWGTDSKKPIRKAMKSKPEILAISLDWGQGLKIWLSRSALVLNGKPWKIRFLSGKCKA
jgi:hypothetical protein